MSKQNPLKEAIQSYLDNQAKKDELFAKAYAKEGKNIDECCSYIMGEANKRGNAVCMSDEEVFGLAIHYYDEDDIKVNKISANVKTSVSTPVAKPIKLTEEDKKKAREAAIKRLTEEQYALLRKKSSRAKKEVPEVQQMSLF